MKIDYAALWQEGIRDWNGKIPERMINDEIEEAFWRKYTEQKKEAPANDFYAESIRSHLAPMIQKGDHVLEIGPGWGSYTFFLCERAKKVTCVDSSQSILNYLKQETEKQDIQHLAFSHSKWEELQPDKKYDIVFGMNCFYRMFDIRKALLNIHYSAKRHAIIGMTTGPLPPHYMDLHQRHGINIKFPRKDYIHLQNLLYEMGIYAQCDIIRLERISQFASHEELIQKSKSKILDQNVPDRLIREALEPYITFSDGFYTYKYPFHAAILHWEPGHFTLNNPQ